jgi:hypothetical protein
VPACRAHIILVQGAAKRSANLFPTGEPVQQREGMGSRSGALKAMLDEVPKLGQDERIVRSVISIASLAHNYDVIV